MIFTIFHFIVLFGFGAHSFQRIEILAPKNETVITEDNHSIEGKVVGMTADEILQIDGDIVKAKKDGTFSVAPKEYDGLYNSGSRTIQFKLISKRTSRIIEETEINYFVSSLLNPGEYVDQNGARIDIKDGPLQGIQLVVNPNPQQKKVLASIKILSSDDQEIDTPSLSRLVSVSPSKGLLSYSIQVPFDSNLPGDIKASDLSLFGGRADGKSVMIDSHISGNNRISAQVKNPDYDYYFVGVKKKFQKKESVRVTIQTNPEMANVVVDWNEFGQYRTSVKSNKNVEVYVYSYGYTDKLLKIDTKKSKELLLVRLSKNKINLAAPLLNVSPIDTKKGSFILTSSLPEFDANAKDKMLIIFLDNKPNLVKVPQNGLVSYQISPVNETEVYYRYTQNDSTIESIKVRVKP